MIAAVAQAARAVPSPAKDSALESLDYLGAMGNHLSFLSGQATAVMAGDSCKFNATSMAGYVMSVTSCGAGIEYCLVNQVAYLSKNKIGGTCKRNYWARLYDNKGNLLAKDQRKLKLLPDGSGIYHTSVEAERRGRLHRKGSKLCRKSRFGDSAGNKFSPKAVCSTVKSGIKRTIFWNTTHDE